MKFFILVFIAILFTSCASLSTGQAATKQGIEAGKLIKEEK